MTERVLPKVGAAVWVIRDGKVLMGKRRKASGDGMWCPPGGHFEMFETLEECVAREAREETGIEIETIRFVAYTNDFNKVKGLHYLTMHFAARWLKGEVQDFPNESIGEWSWFAWDKLPAPIFYPARTFVENGYNPFNFLTI